MQSPKMDLKDIPLFYKFFGSSSIKFKSEHVWILRLIHAGLNLDEDAQILMNKFVVENLLSFYGSSLSDRETKVVILQILKKSVKLHMLASRLVMNSGLLSWLYYLLMYYGERFNKDDKEFSMGQLELILEVVLDVISIRTIFKWLKGKALEQLSKISSYLHKLIVDSLGLLKGNASIIDSIFLIITSTLRISQKRKVYQPHFTLSLEGISQMSHVMGKELRDARFSATTELGLTTLLMCTPPAVVHSMDKEKLAKIILQAIPSTLISFEKVRVLKELDSSAFKFIRDTINEESLLEKLLRWIIASIIVGFVSISCTKANASFDRSQIENLHSLLENMIIRNDNDGDQQDDNCRSNVALAAIILHLQLLTASSALLPSVILALYLLLIHNEVQDTPVQEFLVGNPNNYLLSLCSKIRCPAEAYSAWRWSFHEPWRNMSNEQTSIQMAEEQACQVLLLAFSNSLEIHSLASPVLSQADLDTLFLWEKEIVLGAE